MNARTAFYLSLISDFTAGSVGAVEFCDRFITSFKEEKVDLPEREFLILDELFGDADSYTDDQELIVAMPDFYVSAEQLKERAEKARVALVTVAS